jgi:NhaP-type Na+/H+ or K+/H+ antiporter
MFKHWHLILIFHVGTALIDAIPETSQPNIPRTAMLRNERGEVGNHESVQKESTSLVVHSRFITENYNTSSNGDDDDDLCSEFLQFFLQGTTNSKDNCDGIQNAYSAANCGIENENYTSTRDDDHDDYLDTTNQYSCCQGLKNHFGDYCYEEKLITSFHLLLIASVLLLCELAKHFIKHHDLRMLPEAGGCILVGAIAGAFAQYLHGDESLEGFGFSEDLFLCVLLPPIIFAEALSVNKQQFCRMRLGIFMMAIVGTILSNFMIGIFVYFASRSFESITTLPLLDSLIFGSLISSIDPATILTALSALKWTDDSAFIMILGENLLNDGVVITIFNSLISHYSSGKVSIDEVLEDIANFFIIGVVSVSVGIFCGLATLIYFWSFQKNLNSRMEVASFFVWAAIPYYVCNAINASGIFGIVTMIFILDFYFLSSKPQDIFSGEDAESDLERSTDTLEGCQSDCYMDFNDLSPWIKDGLIPPANMEHGITSGMNLRAPHFCQVLLHKGKIKLSSEAEKHIRFVSNLLSQLAKNCIYAYLGFFLCDKNFKWDISLIGIAITSCVVSRVIIVLIICNLVWYINKARQRLGC